MLPRMGKRKPWGRTLCKDRRGTADQIESNIGGSDGRKYLPPDMSEQMLMVYC